MAGVGLAAGLPFVGFGFLDNFIMVRTRCASKPSTGMIKDTTAAMSYLVWLSAVMVGKRSTDVNGADSHAMLCVAALAGLTHSMVAWSSVLFCVSGHARTTPENACI